MRFTQARFAERTEGHRRELQVHCYRMLGSFEEAEDLVQETMLRARRRRDDLDRDEHLRAWLYSIATNACLDSIKAKGRRVPSLGSFRDIPWLEPYPDALLEPQAPVSAEPAASVIGRETIELTFLAVIQLLPPRQRAVLILRQVLDWPASESPTFSTSASPRSTAPSSAHGRRSASTSPPRPARIGPRPRSQPPSAQSSTGRATGG